MKKNGAFKIIFTGDICIGAKTSLILKITDDTFSCNYLSTIGSDFKVKIIQNQFGKKYKFLLYDTAGQERFRTITLQLIKGSHCIILGYDITQIRSFESIKNYYYDNAISIVGDSALFYLVGNKIDLPHERQVSLEEARSFAEEKNIKFFEVSVKTGEGVYTLFDDITNSLINKFPNIGEIKEKNKIVSNKNNNINKKKQNNNEIFKTKQQNNNEIKIYDNNNEKKDYIKHSINSKNSYITKKLEKFVNY